MIALATLERGDANGPASQVAAEGPPRGQHLQRSIRNIEVGVRDCLP